MALMIRLMDVREKAISTSPDAYASGGHTTLDQLLASNRTDGSVQVLDKVVDGAW